MACEAGGATPPALRGCAPGGGGGEVGIGGGCEESG